MYTRSFRILWEEKKVFLIIYVGFLVKNKNIGNTDDREKMLYLLVQYCIYYCFTCSYDTLHQLFKFSNVAFEKKKLPNSSKEKHKAFLAYTYASLWKSQKLRHGVTGLIFTYTSAKVL